MPLEAGIASLHSTAPDWASTDWDAMVGLYEQLERMTGSPVVTINACVAQAMSGQAQPALDRLDALSNDTRTGGYAPFHIARAEVLRQLSRDAEAEDAYRAALEAGISGPVMALLQERLSASDTAKDRSPAP